MLHIHITCIWNSFFYSSFLFCSAWCQPSSGNISKCAFMPISHTTRHFAHPLLFSSIFELFFPHFHPHHSQYISQKSNSVFFLSLTPNGDRYVDAHDAHLNMLCMHTRNREAFFLCTVDAAFNRIYVCAYVCTFLDSIPTFFSVSIFYWD